MKNTQTPRNAFRTAVTTAAGWLRAMRVLLFLGKPAIRASVSPKILSKVDRLFSNRLSDIFIELLQNARRAGATTVDVKLEETTAGTRIVLIDNGDGISDFSVLLNLGDSDWDPETDLKEDPAGMGFFSLLHSGVLVRSRGHEANIRKEGFLGTEEIEVRDTHEAPGSGTQLIFLRPESDAQVREILKTCVLYGRLAVRLDGELLPREDFLAEALHVREISGVRIGVYGHWFRSAWNFHGRVLESRHNLPELRNVIIEGNGDRGHLFVRVDVEEAQLIHLKLPDRSAIVEDERYTALCREARVAMYEYLASLPQHAAYFRNFREAQSLGVSLQEASPWFASHYQHPSWDGDNEEFFQRPHAVLATPTEHVIVDRTDGSADSLAFTFLAALERFDQSLALTPLEDIREYEGYSWYATFPRLHSLSLIVDGKDVNESVSTDSILTLADSIQLTFILERDSVQDTVAWEIPFAGRCGGDWDEEARLFVTRSSLWFTAERDAPFDLVDVAVYLAFSPSDDHEADSTDTQLENFRDDTRSAIIRTLGGTMAQLRHALDGALTDWKYNLAGFLREANISELRLRRNGAGQWEPSFLTAEDPAE